MRAALGDRDGGRYPLAVALILAAFALLLVWNVVHYPAGNSMDSTAHFNYVKSLREDQALPDRDFTHEAQTPPFFHISAAVLESTWAAVTGEPGGTKVTHKVVQLFNVLLAVGVALLVFLIARELFPASRVAQIGALGFFALSPPVARTAVMYHGQTLATLLSTAALFVVIRAMRREQVDVKTGALAGVLLGLGVMTRQLVLATFGAVMLALLAYWFFTRRREVLPAAAVLVLSVVLITTPWFIHQQVRYGSPLAQSLDAWASYKDTGKPFFSRQPAEFYLGKPFKTVFTQPYRPAHKNRLPQVLYSDWWGDYFLYYDVPSKLREDAAPGRLPGARLPEPFHGERVRQSYVGIVPTLLMLAGLLALMIEGVRRRSPALLVLPATVVILVLETSLFWIGYPTADGDTMKVFYLVSAIPPLALGVGWLLSRLRARSTVAFGLLIGVLAVVAAVDLSFIFLEHFVGRFDGG